MIVARGRGGTLMVLILWFIVGKWLVIWGIKKTKRKYVIKNSSNLQAPRGRSNSKSPNKDICAEIQMCRIYQLSRQEFFFGQTTTRIKNSDLYKVALGLAMLSQPHPFLVDSHILEKRKVEKRKVINICFFLRNNNISITR